MKFLALLTSAGINIGLCALMLSLYSVLRKQPSLFGVYFGRKLAEQREGLARDGFALERFVPSPRWIVKAWRYSEDEILAIAGLDAVVFLRFITFSIRIFSIAAIVCLFVILPLNYFGEDGHHTNLGSESLDAFSIANIREQSRLLGVHCLALYIISCSACILLYIECKTIARMRLTHIIRTPPKPSHFTILVRAIPRSNEEPISDSVKAFFTKYHSSSYLSHQMIYKTGKIQKLMSLTRRVSVKCRQLETAAVEQIRDPIAYGCLFLARFNSFFFDRDKVGLNGKKSDGHSNHRKKEKECAAAFVFFRNRYAAHVVSQVPQCSNPMIWVTDHAPEPNDIYWSNLWLPFRQLWLRRVATLLATLVIMFLFIIPVTFVQGLTQLEQLQRSFPFLKPILKKTFVIQLATGYLPSVILQLFLYIVPPAMMSFSAMEGPISRSGRKKSAFWKVLYFTIWNVFFINVLSGSVIDQINVLSSPKGIPNQLARAVPNQATFFITYVLTSGWASLSSELMQLFGLLCLIFKKYILGVVDDQESVPSFPYHTEVTRVLLFGLLGFTLSVLAPLILPFLLVYFFLGYVVYCNQIVNVYSMKYETGGLMWPTMHKTTVFSLVLSQIIALGLFGLKRAPVASGFTIPLILFTLLFNEYCRKRFHTIFKDFSAQDLIDMDIKDELSGRMDEIHQEVRRAYGQFSPDMYNCSRGGFSQRQAISQGGDSADTWSKGEASSQVSKQDIFHPTLKSLPITGVQEAVIHLSNFASFQGRKFPT